MPGDPLDIDRILRETFVARAEHHVELASTSDRAKQCAAERRPGEPDELPLLIVADRQTAGRGRGANRWWTGPGSLAISLLLAPEPLAGDRPGRSPLVGLATTVALVETIAPLLPGHTVGIHWPNDVMAAGRKLAGVLVECLPSLQQVVGIGVNTNNRSADAPEELQEKLATLADLTGGEHGHTAFLLTLLHELQHALRRAATEPDRLGTRADQLCLQHGKTLTLRLDNRSIRGTCLGIAADGALLLETQQGPQAFYSGTLE